MKSSIPRVGSEPLPPADPPGRGAGDFGPEIPRDPGKQNEDPQDDDLYQMMSGDELMDDEDGMDMRRVGVVLKELDRGECEHVKGCEKGILLAIRNLGGSRKAYKRERKCALQRIVSEVYSPPGVAAAAKLLPSLGIIPGASLDITMNQEDGTPCDFDVKANREKARTLIEEQNRRC